MSKWVDIGALRAEIACAVKALGEAAGLENVSVYVRVEAPDQRGRRAISVEVVPITTDQVEQFQGRPWGDN